MFSAYAGAQLGDDGSERRVATTTQDFEHDRDYSGTPELKYAASTRANVVSQSVRGTPPPVFAKEAQLRFAQPR